LILVSQVNNLISNLSWSITWCRF